MARRPRSAERRSSSRCRSRRGWQPSLRGLGERLEAAAPDVPAARDSGIAGDLVPGSGRFVDVAICARQPLLRRRHAKEIDDGSARVVELWETGEGEDAASSTSLSDWYSWKRHRRDASGRERLAKEASVAASCAVEDGDLVHRSASGQRFEDEPHCFLRFAGGIGRNEERLSWTSSGVIENADGRCGGERREEAGPSSRLRTGRDDVNVAKVRQNAGAVQ